MWYTSGVLVYHFTSRLHLPVILEYGALRTTDSIAAMDGSGPRCVWFLDGPDLGGAWHGLNGSAVDKTEVRFTCDVPEDLVIAWVPWAQGRGIDEDWFEVMVEAGGGLAAAQRWRCVFQPVERDSWRVIEARDAAGNWARLHPTD